MIQSQLLIEDLWYTKKRLQKKIPPHQDSYQRPLGLDLSAIATELTWLIYKCTNNCSIYREILSYVYKETGDNRSEAVKKWVIYG